jgi:uncharacterized membrane protein YidH (DUF202 family)
MNKQGMRKKAEGTAKMEVLVTIIMIVIMIMFGGYADWNSVNCKAKRKFVDVASTVRMHSDLQYVQTYFSLGYLNPITTSF